MDEPVAAAEDEATMTERIRSFLEEQVRPALAYDGGDCQLAGYHDGVVQVRMVGACGGCSFAAYDLTVGVEQMLREAFPDHYLVVEQVEP